MSLFFLILGVAIICGFYLNDWIDKRIRLLRKHGLIEEVFKAKEATKQIWIGYFLMVVFSLVFSFSCSFLLPSCGTGYTGDPKKVSVIIHEKLLDCIKNHGGERCAGEVFDELQEEYLKKGWGMERCAKTIEEYSRYSQEHPFD